MKLVITKVLDRAKLSFRLKEIYRDYHYSEILNLIDNLPIENKCVFINPERIKLILEDCAEYTYEAIQYISLTASDYGTPTYLEAKKWYDSLSKEKKEYFAILVKNPEPYLG